MPEGAQKEHEEPGLDTVHPPYPIPSPLVFPVSLYTERVWGWADTARRKLEIILAATDRQCFPTACVPHGSRRQLSACSGLCDSWHNPSAIQDLQLLGCLWPGASQKQDHEAWSDQSDLSEGLSIQNRWSFWLKSFGRCSCFHVHLLCVRGVV